MQFHEKKNQLHFDNTSHGRGKWLNVLQNNEKIVHFAYIEFPHG